MEPYKYGSESDSLRGSRVLGAGAYVLVEEIESKQLEGWGGK